ncbi:MAG TPA: M67 family metallopeptidase [Candidatus Acidoferrales bacterium]|jgi:proteasome lid subunit RPN8/RPN11|nr:M67 family metallopeptidase [Candidatus Acidoferrales bacterium]
MLRLSEKLALRIREQGAKSYPQECCGALLGRDSSGDREIVDLLPLDNRHAESPGNRYVISPHDVRRAEQTAGQRGLELVGWYHSHPDHPALPSEFDRAQAWPWYSYVILSVQQRRPGQLTSWRLGDDRARFSPERIAINGNGRR